MEENMKCYVPTEGIQTSHILNIYELYLPFRILDATESQSQTEVRKLRFEVFLPNLASISA
jgi:hypothetical protein